MTTRRHIWFSGRVQGVYFRGTSRSIAQRLGLNGWVRNLWDRRVEMVVEGEAEQIDKLIQEIEREKPNHITQMEVQIEEPQDEQGFHIEY